MFNAYNIYSYEQDYQAYPNCYNNNPDDWEFNKRYLNQNSDEHLPDNQVVLHPVAGSEPTTAPLTKTLKQAIASLNVMYRAANEEIPLQNYTAESDIYINDSLMSANMKRRRFRRVTMPRRLADPKKLEMNTWLKHMDEWYTAEMRKDCPKLALNHKKDRRVRIAQLQRC
uniref:Uncharacterized protein n=1 Tax=Bactrocera latifrons TaxID=174628 RepID=A0A0K8WLE3_BACLA